MVVFDLDGTLYDQPPLRRAMAVELVRDAFAQRSLRTIRILRAFRRIRETLNGQDFLEQQYRLTAAACRCNEADVRAVVHEWLEERPLRSLARFKALGIDSLFASIRATGRKIAVWSDYPVADKLAALGLVPDLAVWAGDPAVGMLKPNPLGLKVLIARAGVRARETLVIGDRAERDAAAAKALGARTLLRSARAHDQFTCFRQYDEPVFAGIQGLGQGAGSP